MKIIGHRGARGEAPENTLGGFQYIHDLGIRAVEFDVRQLKDNALIVMHDDQFSRTAGQDKALYECRASELNQYNQSFHWTNWPQQETTPLLCETLNILQDFEHIEVEVKAVNHMDEAEHIVETLHQQLLGFENIAVITSFDTKIHQALNQQTTPFKHGLLIEEDLKFKAIEQALELGCCQIGWMDSLANDQIIQATQQANLNISVWTVNDIHRAEHLKNLGVQGLITDYPQRMLQHFET
jgi:glycerophosphoryl diester phosphodiesterase